MNDKVNSLAVFMLHVYLWTYNLCQNLFFLLFKDFHRVFALEDGKLREKTLHYYLGILNGVKVYLLIKYSRNWNLGENVYVETEAEHYAFVGLINQITRGKRSVDRKSFILMNDDEPIDIDLNIIDNLISNSGAVDHYVDRFDCILKLLNLNANKITIFEDNGDTKTRDVSDVSIDQLYKIGDFLK